MKIEEFNSQIALIKKKYKEAKDEYKAYEGTDCNWYGILEGRMIGLKEVLDAFVIKG